MKKLLLSISIAALAFTAMEDVSAGIFTTKSPEQKAQEKKDKEEKQAREADVKAMKTCAADLTQQTKKVKEAFDNFSKTLGDKIPGSKDASEKTPESLRKVMNLQKMAVYVDMMVSDCLIGCMNVERGLNAKDDSARDSYFKQANNIRGSIKNGRTVLGISIVNSIEEIIADSLEIFNDKECLKAINKLDGELRGTGKKNEVGASTSWKIALEKFEDQALKYHNLNRDDALDMSDEEADEYPLYAFATNDLEYIRKILSDVLPAFVAFASDLCNGKQNNGSSFIQSVRQALKIKGLQVSSELEYDENEAKAKKSRRQGNNNKYAKKKNLGEGSSQWGNTEAEDAKNYELSEEDEEFFDSERKKSAKARGSEAEKRSNKGKVKKTEEDEDLAESKKTASKKKSRDAEDVENEELSEEEEEFFDSERKKSAAKRKAKEDSAKKASKGKPFEAEDRSQLDDEDEPLPEDDEDDEDQKKTKKVTKKDVQKMDEALRAADKRRQATQSKGGGKAPAVKGQWRAAASEA